MPDSIRKPRWTDEELRLLRDCIRAGLTYSEMQERFREAGFDRPRRALIMKATRTGTHKGAAVPASEAGVRDWFNAWLERQRLAAETRGEEPVLRIDYSRSQWDVPDITCVTPDGRLVRIEVEYLASGFLRDHGAEAAERVDMIVCWRMDDPALLRLGVEVLELSTETLYRPAVQTLRGA